MQLSRTGAAEVPPRWGARGSCPFAGPSWPATVCVSRTDDIVYDPFCNDTGATNGKRCPSTFLGYQPQPRKHQEREDSPAGSELCLCRRPSPCGLIRSKTGDKNRQQEERGVCPGRQPPPQLLRQDRVGRTRHRGRFQRFPPRFYLKGSKHSNYPLDLVPG